MPTSLKIGLATTSIRRASGSTPVTVPDPDAFFPLKTTIVATTGASTLSFTRATVDNVQDHEGLLKPVLSGEVPFANARRVYNRVVTTSQDFSDAAWSKSTMTIATGISDPLSGTSACTFTATGANSTVTRSITSSGVVGDVTVFSIWLRRRTGTGTVQIRSNSGTVYTTVTLTSSWQRFALNYTLASTTNVVGVRLVTSGDEVDAFGAQFENIAGQAITAPGEYVSVGVLSAPYHGANVDGVKYFTTANGNTVASNVVTEATGAALTDTAANPIGYHAEPAATNICKRSDAADNATWVKTNITVTANAAVTTPINGSQISDTLTATANNATFIQDLGTLGSAAYTFSVYIRRRTGTGNIDMTLDGGATWTTKTITGSFARYSITQTLADPDCGIRIATNTDEIDVVGMQVETGSYATRYIATTGSNVTRNADALTVPDTVYSDTAGTVSAEVSCESQANATAQRLFGPLLRLNATTIDSTDGTNAPTCTTDIADRKTLSTAWGSGTQRLAATGATAGTGNYDGGWGGSGTTPIGRSTSDTATSSIILSNLKVWNSKLSSAQQDLLVG